VPGASCVLPGACFEAPPLKRMPPIWDWIKLCVDMFSRDEAVLMLAAMAKFGSTRFICCYCLCNDSDWQHSLQTLSIPFEDDTDTGVPLPPSKA
jgi:hypothetical protein